MVSRIALRSVVSATLVLSLACGGNTPAPAVKPPILAVAETAPTQVMGSVSGTFSVGSGGSAGYQVDVEVPPGTNGMEPDLSIQYASGGGNGILGVGFSLEGLASIQRCGRSLLQDGQKGGVNYDSNDRFCLQDGDVSDGRLININSVSGGYGGDGALYRTEQETWRQVEAHGSCGGGPCSFTVTLKNGVVQQFAATAPAVGSTVPSGAIRAWLLSSVTDLNGNEMTITYTDTPSQAGGGTVSGTTGLGAYYPASISYTSNGSLQARRSVQFFYVTRPDLVQSNLGGAHVGTAALLSNIRTFVTPDATPVLVKDYRLTYAAGGTQRSLLQSVTECDVAGTCFPPTTFTWSPAPTGYISVDASTGNLTGNANSWTGDFNGDGRTDILGLEGGNLQPCFSTGNGFNCPDSIYITLGTYVFIADFNADGLSDLYSGGGSGTEGGTASIYFSTSGGLSTTATPVTNLTYGDDTYVADFNGDGMADLFSGGPSGNTYTYNLYLANGSGLGAANPVTNVSLDQQENYIADFNGDGMTDLLTVNCTGGSLYLSTGTGFTYKEVSGIQLCQDTTMVADFNGDGLSDLLATGESNGQPSAYISYGNGAGFDTAINFTGMDTGQGITWPGDFNGDGRMDVYVAGPTNGSLYQSIAPVTGTDMPFAYSSVDSQSIEPQSGWLGDFNGDGIADLYDSDANIRKLYVTGPSSDSSPPTTNQAADYLTGVATGLGGGVTITYKPMTDASIYTPAFSGGAQTDVAQLVNKYASTPLATTQVAQYPVMQARGPLYLVSNYTLANVPSANAATYSYSYDYSYSNALVNLLGRGWLGFASTTVLDHALDARTTETYRQDFPYNGQVSTTWTCSDASSTTPCSGSDADLLKTSVAVMECTDTLANAPCVVDNDSYSSSATQVYEVLLQSRTATDASWGLTSTDTYDYDLYGNQVQRAHTGATSASTIVRCANYSNDPTNWRIGFLTDSKLSTTSTCPAAGSWSSYPFGTGDLSWKHRVYDGSMNLTNELEWDSQNALWVGTQSGYDDYGNATSAARVTSPQSGPISVVSNTTESTGFDSTYQTFPVSSTTPPANPAVSTSSITTRTLYDPRFGTLVGQQNANGQVLTTCLDGFGRTAATQGPPVSNDGAIDTNCLGASTPFSVPSTFSAASVVTLTKITPSAVGSPNVYWQTNSRLDWTSSPQWSTSQSYIDGLNRSFLSVDPSDTPGVTVLEQTQYLNEKLVSQKSFPYFSNAQPLWSTTTYDALGRRTSTTQPAELAEGQSSSVVTTWVYCSGGTTILTVNPSAAVTCSAKTPSTYARQSVSTFDQFITGPRRLTITQTADQNALTTFQRDALGRLTTALAPTSRVDGTRVSTTAAYDSLARLTSQSVSGVSSYQYFYDTLGRLDHQTDALGQRIQFAYDGLNRVLTRTAYTSANAVARTATYGYDTSPSPSTYANVIGRTATATTTDANDATIVSYTYGYDPYGRTTAAGVSLGGSYYFSASYDPQSRPSSLTYPNSAVAGMQYTPGSNFGTLSLTPPGGSATSYAVYSGYDASGNVGTATYANGTTESRDWSVQGTLLTHALTDSAGALQLNQSYQWDSLGNPTNIWDCNYSGNASQPGCSDPGTSTEDESEQYGYTAQRLTSASGPGYSTSFVYDANGNLLQQGNTTFTYSGYLLKSGSNGYVAGYDANGSMTGRTIPGGKVSWVQTFDPEGNLTALSSEGKTRESYQYDDAGRRVSKTIYANDGVTVEETTTYIGSTVEVATRGTSSETTLYLDDPSGHVVAFRGANTSYLHSDPLMSTLRITGASGSVASTIDYRPYGASVASPAGSAALAPKFNGQRADDGSGLMDFNARLYDPAIGRYISADDQVAGPVTRQDALNRYAFVWNAPATWADPSGRVGEVLAEIAVEEVVIDVIAVGEQTARRATTAATLDVTTTNVLTAAGDVGKTTSALSTTPSVNLEITKPIKKSRKGVPKPSLSKNFDRAGWRKGQVDELLSNARKVHGTDGLEFKCPTCNTVMSGKKVRQGKRMVVDYDIDHTGGLTWDERKHALNILESHPTYGGEDYTRKQVIDVYHEDLRLQCPKCNRSHRHEPTELERNLGYFVFAADHSTRFKPPT